MTTVFTKIINRELPAKIFYETDDVIVISDHRPRRPIHLLIIWKAVYENFQATPPEVLATCFETVKIVADKHGDLCYVRVYSGELKAGTRVLNAAKDKRENVPQLWHLQADNREQVKQVSAGDIVGVIGLPSAVTGDTLCDPQHPIVLERIEFPETVISMAIEPESSAERKKLAATLEMMKRQDPTFRASESEETGQTLIRGMGGLHLEVIKHRLLRDFNLNVKVHKPRVSYRETVCTAAEATGEFSRTRDGETDRKSVV